VTQTMSVPSTRPHSGRWVTGLTLLTAGAAATVVVAALPFIASFRAVLAAHVAAGYPAYSPEAIDAAVAAYTGILVTVGAIGLVGWIASAWAAYRDSRIARPLMAVLLALGLVVAVTGLTMRDTSGDVGLAPMFGWMLLGLCAVGAAALAAWRREKA